MELLNKINQDLILNEMLNQWENGCSLNTIESLTNTYEEFNGNKILISLIDKYLNQEIKDRNKVICEIKKNITVRF